MRPIYYPPIKGQPKGAVRAAAHGDINLITLLMGASASGLEVQTKKGEWIPVTGRPLPTAFQPGVSRLMLSVIYLIQDRCQTVA